MTRPGRSTRSRRRSGATSPSRLDAVTGPDGAGPPDEDEIRRLLSGHLCRCTGYEPIVAAIAEVATALQLTGIEPADIEPAETEIDRVPPGGAEPSP